MLSATERADSAGLHYVEPESLPIRRVRDGKSFAFLDRRAQAVRDSSLKARVQKLAVPPAWDEVKLALDPKIHIHAVGQDEAGRLQYKYHACWTEPGHDVKRERFAHLGETLEAVREGIAEQLRRHTADEASALACAVALLDRAGLPWILTRKRRPRRNGTDAQGRRLD